MSIYTQKIAPVEVTEKQKKHLKRKSMNNDISISDIIRAYIDKDMEDKKRG